MRTLLQRVSSANVQVDGQLVGQIGKGLVLLCGFEQTDGQKDIEWSARKICNMRIFSDKESLMNLSIGDVNGDILLVSQFTLHAKTKKGNRPSFIQAAKPELAKFLYGEFGEQLEKEMGKKISYGVFGAMMDVCLVNDGPVTLWLDSKNKE